MNIDIDGLQAFVQVAELTTFRQAAEALFVSQPALSRRIRKLEAYLGVRLFDRTTRRVRLTAVGREFLPQARRLIEELEGALTSIKDMGKHGAGQVTFACIPTATYLLPNVIRKYSSEFPKNRVRILDVHGNEAWQTVLNGEAEFGITVKKEIGSDIEFDKLFDDQYVLACSRTHPLAKKKTVKWEELGEHRLISVGRLSGYRTQVEFVPFNDAMRRAGIYEVQHSFSTGLAMAEAGIAAIPVPRLAMSRVRHAGLVCRPLVAPVLVRTIGIIRRRGSTLSPAVGKFLSLLRKQCATY